jgi:hypothetical protein
LLSDSLAPSDCKLERLLEQPVTPLVLSGQPLVLSDSLALFGYPPAPQQLVLVLALLLLQVQHRMVRCMEEQEMPNG